MNNTRENHVQKILIINDHIIFREGLVSLFQFTPDFTVVDQAGSVKEGIEKAFQHKPDIILMDFSLPDGTGLDATSLLIRKMLCYCRSKIGIEAKRFAKMILAVYFTVNIMNTHFLCAT